MSAAVMNGYLITFLIMVGGLLIATAHAVWPRD